MKWDYVVAFEGYFEFDGRLYFLDCGKIPSYYGRTPFNWWIAVKEDRVCVYELDGTLIGFAVPIPKDEIVDIGEKSLRRLLKEFRKHQVPPPIRQKKKLRSEIKNLPDDIITLIVKALKSGRSLLSVYKEIRTRYNPPPFSLSKFYKIADEIKDMLKITK